MMCMHCNEISSGYIIYCEVSVYAATIPPSELSGKHSVATQLICLASGHDMTAADLVLYGGVKGEVVEGAAGDSELLSVAVTF